ncbi:putative cytosol aminopeptidase [Candidatus Sulfotelmatomonas gaucii]|uniref:Probable cytosol aminopeptidase n=1 Tax=Candidatus Sulfuritelmatomonas gaucii TaxID=2043161 RepID=A0A2N9LXV7_9BACT|nr:putative cytosol aminopeptidase [Candidatus Sulfotelmatomonas gaucii]
MRTQISFASIAGIQTDLLAVLAADTQAAKTPDARPQPALLTGDPAVQAAAAGVLSTGEFKAGSNETVLLHAPAGLAAKRLLIVGLGKQSKATIHKIRDAAGTAVRFAKPRGIREIVLALPSPENLVALSLSSSKGLPAAGPAVEGAIIADFDPDTYRSDRKDQSIQSFTLVAPPGADHAAIESALAEGVVVGESQNFARSLVNEPGNKLTPTILGQRAAEMAQQVGLACEVHSTEKLRELKMGAFWSVAQGSVEPPALIVLRYEPEGVDNGPVLHPTDKDPSVGAPVLGLVGKGITFDTGGISIKPADNMEKMKYDMAGGAAMLGAMRAIALLKPKVRVLAIVCAAENMPSGTAQKPGDVQTAMPIAPDRPGKTIEIINTDAEGRLVLADGLTFARQLGATHLIDAATLTGAISVALGKTTAGSFSNDEPAYAKFEAALRVSGEKFWRLPLGEEYADLIKSDIGDIKNAGGRYGGASIAAEFLHTFAEDTPWIHLDIAGVAWVDEAKPFVAKGPSGVAVRSILEWVRSW